MTTSPAPAVRHVGCDLGLQAGPGGVTLVLQVAPAVEGAEVVDEVLLVEHDSLPLEAVVTVIAGPHGGRLHVVTVPEGPVHVAYTGSVRPVVGAEEPRGPVDAIDRHAHEYLRQSRYCPSDEVLGWATSEFGDLPGPSDKVAAIADWVFERITYVPGSSGPLDTAVDTLLTGRGVCRDLAHLTVTLCRALEIPARMAAVYAPGLAPMDFHAVAEVRVDGRWEVVDATRLAPRSALVRIATGRDAADTSFLSTLAGDAELLASTVTAVIDGDLPADDHRGRMRLA